MSDETVLVVALLLGIAIMIVGLVRYQRGKERRLAARAEIEIPVESMWRSALVLLPSLAAGPSIVVALAVTWDEAREHALAVTLATIGVGMIGLWMGMRLSRRFRRIGVLRYTSASLDLELGGVRRHLDLGQPYTLAEGLAFGPARMPLQVVTITQNGEPWGFSYGLPLGRKPYGNRSLDAYLDPLLAGETRIIHDRLRERIKGSGQLDGGSVER